MSIYNWQTHPNHWNIIITIGMTMTLLFTPCQALLNAEQVTFDYSTLKARISKTTNDRNKRISDSESRHLGDHICLRGSDSYKNNIHVQRDAQKHCFIYPRTTLKRNCVRWHNKTQHDYFKFKFFFLSCLKGVIISGKKHM